MRCGDFKETYKKDEAIFQSWFARFWLIVFLLFLLTLPLVADDYVLYIANLIGFAVIGSVGLNILTGFTGQISLGHAAFAGVGGYTSAVLISRFGFSFWAALPCAGLMAALTGLIIGIPSLRVKGLYLCIATLAAQFIFEFIFVHWDSMTRGVRGINIPAPSLGGFQLNNEHRYYYLTLLVVVIAVLFAYNLFRTRVGRAFVAIRDRDLAAEIMGISLFRYKLTSFAISSFYAGISGALLLGFMRIVTPEHFPLHLSIQYLAMIIIGGLGSILGSIFGAIFMILLPELLNILASSINETIPGSGQLFIPLKEVVFGSLIVAFLIFEPLGLAEIWRRIKNFFMLWPFSH
jgi:branched-chain amino acid transport system permease protein